MRKHLWMHCEQDVWKYSAKTKLHSADYKAMQLPSVLPFVHWMSQKRSHADSPPKCLDAWNWTLPSHISRVFFQTPIRVCAPRQFPHWELYMRTQPSKKLFLCLTMTMNKSARKC